MKWRGLFRSTSGNASIEFALVLLPFCLLLMGMIDYGWYFFVDLACTNAVREGARVATTIPGACPNGNATNLGSGAVTTALTGLLPASYAPTVTATCTTVANGLGANSPQFKVALTLNFPRLTGFTIPMPAGNGQVSTTGNVNVSTSATMRGIQ